MAGQIIISNIKTDSDNAFSILANTGAVIFSANLASGITTGIADGTITNAKLAGSITGDKLTVGSLAGNVFTANTITGDKIGQSAISSNNIVSVNASVATVGTLPTARLPAGSVLQVVSVTKTNTTSFVSSSTNAYVDITGMSVTITPTSATSKILVMYTVGVSQSTSATIHIRLYRGSTSIGQGDSSGNRLGDSLIWRPNGEQYAYDIGPLSSSFLDSPATTSATTYKLAATLGSTYSGTFYLNRSSTDNDADYSGRTASTITVMEIAA
jgi:hypothetical protein